MKNFISSLIIALSILSINACSKKNVEDTPATNNEQSSVENEQKKPIDTNPDGTYEYKQGPQRCELTISGNTWNAKTIMESGFGPEYDETNATYQRGIIDGESLKDETGYVTLGSISQSSNGDWDISLSSMSFDKVR